jgi:hypothetical protein
MIDGVPALSSQAGVVGNRKHGNVFRDIARPVVGHDRPGYRANRRERNRPPNYAQVLHKE